MSTVPTFLIIGEAGDGKSSVIKTLIKEDQEHIPEVGRRAEGVTKDISEYQISGFDNADWALVDTMGVGDHDKGLGELVAGLKHVFEMRQVDGVIVTTMVAQGRLGLTIQILKELITHGLVKDENGIPPWGRVIVLGTQRDRCDKEEIDDFPGIAQKFFKDTGHTPLDFQITTSSVKQTDGMSDLLASMSKLGRQPISWNPDFNAGAFARGVCQHTGGDPTLMTLEVEMKLKWQDVLAQQFRQGAAEKAGNLGTQALAMQGGNQVVEAIQKNVGKEIIQRYASQRAATGIGSGFVKEGVGRVAIAEGSEAAVGKIMMQGADKSGQAFLRSGGNISMSAVSVGTRKVLSDGIAAGSSIIPGFAGGAAEIVAEQFEVTKEYKKPIGFVAQVTTATTMGAMAGGALGAVVGAGAGTVSWAVGYGVGWGAEQAFLQAQGGTDNPVVQAYLDAKKAFEDAKTESEAQETCEVPR